MAGWVEECERREGKAINRLVFAGICFALGGYFIYASVTHRADQGIVRDASGTVWKLYRMQKFGMGEDRFPVYKNQNSPVFNSAVQEAGE